MNKGGSFDSIISQYAKLATGDAEEGIPPRAGTSTAGNRSGRTRRNTIGILK